MIHTPESHDGQSRFLKKLLAKKFVKYFLMLAIGVTLSVLRRMSVPILSNVADLVTDIFVALGIGLIFDDIANIAE